MNLFSEVVSFFFSGLLLQSHFRSRCAPVILLCLFVWKGRCFPLRWSKVYNLVCCHFLVPHILSFWSSSELLGMWLWMCSGLLEVLFDPWVPFNWVTFPNLTWNIVYKDVNLLTCLFYTHSHSRMHAAKGDIRCVCQFKRTHGTVPYPSPQGTLRQRGHLA